MEKMKSKEYEKKLTRLQAELCELQEWVKAKGLRVIVIFEAHHVLDAGTVIPGSGIDEWSG